ncbi:insulinase family protein [Marinobacterium litorale]|uniref:insulinase family protein n=1 Tax=Marinobacterium litorale TaxID=404770 RepID=UPI000423CEE4|nr:insulinase family protein [Marinobacterium litorale]
MPTATALRPFQLLLGVMLTLTATLVQAALIQSPSDTRQYDAFELPNRLQVVVISDPQASKAAASMNIQAGSRDNPPGREGLAHFLEHMLFLGTEKYPQADAYQGFISANGGSHNAYTAFEHTNYFFDVKADALPGALDRFAQFFIAPLFTPEYVDRERNAVESEFRAKIRDDGRRLYVASKLAMNPEHPYSQFAVGNLETLSNTTDAAIRQDLIDFYQSHYSANRMTLAVIGPQPLDRLRELVTDTFSAVPDRDLPKITTEVPLYRAESLPLALDVKTLMQTRQLRLTFPIPAIRDHWREKPVRYLASLIGYEGKGSLLSLLKEKGWARALGASAGIELEEGATFDINIELTETGLKESDAVVDAVFAFIDELRDNGIRQSIYEEEALLAETDFRFREPREPIHEVMGMSSRMPYYPEAHLLDAPYRYDAFNPELIQDYLGFLVPDNMVLMRAAPTLETAKSTPRYKIDYQLAPVAPHRLADWKTPEDLPGLYVRGPNPFIAHDLSLVAKPEAADSVPAKVWHADSAELWYLQDTSFEQPRANVRLALLSQSANADARASVMSQLYARMVSDRLNETLYDASLAGMSANLYAHLQGLSLRLSGYSERQSRLLDTLITAMTEPPHSEARFQRMKQELAEELANSAKEKPYNQTFDGLYNALLPQWTQQEKLAALASIDLDALQTHIQRVRKDGYLRVLAHGNLRQEQAQEMAQAAARGLLLRDGKSTPPQLPVVQLPPGERLYKTLDIEHDDASLNLYMQGENTRITTRAEVALLAEIISTPFYNRLRTEQQLGYVVFASSMPIREVPGLVLVSQSPVADPLQLESAYNTFLDSTEGELKEMDEARLNAFRQSLISRLNQPEDTLGDRTSRFWTELDRDNADFDTRERLTEAVKQITREDLQSRFRQLRTRSLAVRSFSQKETLAGAADNGAIMESLKEQGQYVPGS